MFLGYQWMARDGEELGVGAGAGAGDRGERSCRHSAADQQ